MSELDLPPIIFGTSCLGNLYQAIPYETKLNILKTIFENSEGEVVLDTAGKYGAGLALETIGKGLEDLQIAADRVQISNKLGWYRVPLTTPEQTFEPGAWIDLKDDAIQKISYEGILQCWEQGCELLGEEFAPQLVSVHDPDEYLKSNTKNERLTRFRDIVQAYKALSELKAQGLTKAVGVGAKDWRSIVEVSREIELDWVMFSVSFTIFSHPQELLDFIAELSEKGIVIINSAVFHAGFLTGGTYFDYRKLDKKNQADQFYFSWREKFFSVCRTFDVIPAEACVQFGKSPPGVKSIALNTSKPERVLPNLRSVSAQIPDDFWIAMKDAGLIDKSYPYLGE